MARYRFSTLVGTIMLGVVSLGACSLATRQALPPTATAAAPSRQVLGNGMRVILQQHPLGDMVALQLWLGVGGRDEARAEGGFSHLVEHMLFKGTETLRPGFIEQEVESFGGRANAGTSLDYTFYYLLIPRSRAARGVELLSDMAFNSTFDEMEIRREREVVFEEIARRQDNPRALLFEKLYELTFAGHPYGLPVLGNPEALRAATRSVLRDYYQRHYRPENMTLVVVGQFEKRELEGAIDRSFARIPAQGYLRATLPPQPALDGRRQMTVERSERQVHLGLAWAGPPLGHPDMFAVDVLAHVLGGSRSSRLNQAVRERQQLVTSIAAAYGALQGGGVLSVTAQLEPGDLQSAEAAILAEVDRIQERGIGAGEIRRAVTAAESRHVFSTETVEGLASWYGRSETLWTLQDGLGYLDRLRAVNPADIQAVARRYLNAPYARLALVPKGKK